MGGFWVDKHTKAERLERIFGTGGTNYPQVKPHLGLMSPRPPKQLESRLWPADLARAEGAYWPTKHYAL